MIKDALNWSKLVEKDKDEKDNCYKKIILCYLYKMILYITLYSLKNTEKNIK